MSTIVHMNLVHQGSEQVEKENMINITFGAPFVGNEAVENYAKENELSRNMFHFAAVTDIVPGLLSLGHSFRVVLDEAERQQTKKTRGASVVLNNFVDMREKALSSLESKCKTAIEAYFAQDGKELSTSIAQLMELMSESSESTLQNKYKDSDYVPIGNAVILAQGRPAEKMDQGPKIKERILQSALEDQVRQMSKEEIVAGHSLENYEVLVEGNGFKTFPRDDQRIKLNKIPLRHKFDPAKFEFLTLCDSPEVRFVPPATAGGSVKLDQANSANLLLML